MSHASQEHYRRIQSPTGKSLRAFFEGALTDADQLPGKAALQKEAAELAEQIPGVNAAKLVEAYTTYARKAQDRGARFRLRGEVLQLAGALVERIEEADRIVPVEPDEVVDLDALADRVEGKDTYWAQQDRERKAALDAAEARQDEYRRVARAVSQ